MPYGRVQVVDEDGLSHCHEDEHDVESSQRVKANPRSKDKVEVKITRNVCAKKKSVAPNRNSVEKDLLFKVRR
jgi:hypothetical protein